MNNFRLALLGSVATGLLSTIVSPVAAGEVEKTMAISGHVNRAIVISDDGNGTTVGQIDNTSVSGSRFRIDANAKSESLTVRAYTELGIQANPASSSQADATSRSINIRHSYVSLANDMGTLTIGHTSTVDDGSTASDLSGSGTAGSYIDSTIDGEVMRVSGNSGTASSGITVGSILPNYEGGRSSNIKYQSPNMSGFQASLGYSDSEHGAASLKYSADYDGTKVAATAAWGSRGAAANDAEYGGSIAISLASGLNGSLAYSQRDLNGSVAANAGLNDPEMFGAAIGYTTGNSGVSIFYIDVEDQGANGNEAKSFALVMEHKLPDYGTSLYGGIQNVDYDTTAIKYDDLTAGWVGIKVNF